MAAGDKHWAQKALIDPLTEPEPSAVDGPGTHFVQSPTRKETASSINSELASNNPFRRVSGSVTSNGTGNSGYRRHGSVEKAGSASSHTRELSSGSRSPRREVFPGSPTNGQRPRGSSDLRKEALGNENATGGRHRAGSNPHGNASRNRQGSGELSGRPRRSSSLRQRYPGDPTDHPLDMLKQENKLAQRSHHLRKNQQARPDTVDALDMAGPSYHHGGPYDAALLARNTHLESSPVAALKMTNDEALKATPEEKIKDSLNGHRPLDGTAIVPPGHRDAFGRLYEYEEGEDMMRAHGGDYKRWPGIQYHPDDLKGKGEPSYTIEKALKEHGDRERAHGTENGEYELVERPKPKDEPEASGTTRQSYGEWESERQRQRSGSHGHARKVSDSIRRRVGSLKRKD